MITLALLIGLGTFKVIDLLKDVTVSYGPWRPWLKSLVSLLIAALFAVVMTDRYTFLPVAIGAAGISALAHEIHSLLYLKNDEMIALLTRGRSRRMG